MSLGILCKRCSQFDPRRHFYSTEHAEQFGVWDKPWACPECGSPDFALANLPRKERVTWSCSTDRLRAVLRVLAEYGGPAIDPNSLDDTTIDQMDTAILSVVERTRPHPTGEVRLPQAAEQLPVLPTAAMIAGHPRAG